MFVETDDEAAGPDEDQERQEDGDEDGVADAGHGDLEHAMQLVSGQGRAGHQAWLSPIASSQQMWPVHSSQLTHNNRGQRLTHWTSHYVLGFRQGLRIHLKLKYIRKTRGTIFFLF